MKSFFTKTCLFIGFLQFSIIAIAQTPCDGNTAGGFPCNGFDLQDQLTLPEMNATLANDSWGWTDPEDGKEYALIGLNNGTAFVDISDPNNILYLGKLPTHTSDSFWRDVKVYQNHAFIVSEAQGHGMQVFDLTRLRTVTNPPITFTEDAHYDGFGNAHNIVINPSSGFAYAVGTQTFAGGPHFVNIQDPTNPTAAGGYAEDDYSHDAQVVTYTGPDPDYTGREILIGSNENEIAIVDITDKANPVGISTAPYPNIGFTHQGWFTEDQRYFLLGDELDELDSGFNSRTIIFDFTDLDQPSVHFEYEGPNPSIDHNGYVVGNTFYLANYTSGLRAIDISNIENQEMEEIGFFDSFINNNGAAFDGAWNVYPFFESGNIIISDTDSGFILVKSNETLNVTSFEENTDIFMFPNPSSGLITINTRTPIGSVTIYNTLGQAVYKTKSADTTTSIDLTHLQTGLYFVKTANATQKLMIK